MASLRRPDTFPNPPELQLYLTERRFWLDFGTPSAPLRDWPIAKVQTYLAISQAIDEVEAERQAEATPSATPGLPQRPATPESVERLKTMARPLPPPPAAPPA